MLGKVFGTPETVRRFRVPRSEDDDLTSGDSDEFKPSGKRITRPRSATVSTSLQRSTKSDTNVKSSRQTRTEVKKEAKTEPAPPSGRSRARSFDSGSSKPQEQESGDTAMSQSSQNESRPISIDLNTNSTPTHKRQLEKRLSDSQLEAGRERRKSRDTPTSPQGDQQANNDIHKDKGRARDVSKSSGGGSRTTTNQATSPTKNEGGSTAGNRQKKRPTKALPTPRPVSAKPSAVLKRLAEQKKEEEAELEAAAVQRSHTDGAETSGTDVAATKEDTVESNHLQNGTIEGEPSGNNKVEATEAVLSNKQSPSKVEESPSKKKTLPVRYNNNLNKVHILILLSVYVYYL